MQVIFTSPKPEGYSTNECAFCVIMFECVHQSSCSMAELAGLSRVTQGEVVLNKVTK